MKIIMQEYNANSNNNNIAMATKTNTFNIKLLLAVDQHAHNQSKIKGTSFTDERLALDIIFNNQL